MSSPLIINEDSKEFMDELKRLGKEALTQLSEIMKEKHLSAEARVEAAALILTFLPLTYEIAPGKVEE